MTFFGRVEIGAQLEAADAQLLLYEPDVFRRQRLAQLQPFEDGGLTLADEAAERALAAGNPDGFSKR
ncbi:MAG TPA: hypothetical protein VF680_01340 [Allosphingosinicella sp.]|jgi:hypothetical protein